MRFIVLALFLSTVPIWVGAKDALPMAQDSVVEEKVKTLAHDLRCLKCQNQSIADSQSGFADQIRNELREQFSQGKTEAEIKNFLTDRYGDFIVYDPPFNLVNALIWVTPVAMLLIGFVALVSVIRRQTGGVADSPMNLEQKSQVKKILAEQDTERSKAEGKSL